MPTYPRYAIISDQSLFHVTWQCHNKKWHLKEDWTKQLYYNLLLRYKEKYQIKIYSYCFMSNHPHLTGYCADKKKFSDFFRIVNSLFARIYNKNKKRRGQLVMDRFKSPLIASSADHLQVMFYGDLNPKRAKMVNHPQEYKWSSFAHYAYGKEDRLLDEAECYTHLGNTTKERQRNYLMMVNEILKNDWKEKKPYSSQVFIGDPTWVLEKYVELRRIRRENRTPPHKSAHEIKIE